MCRAVKCKECGKATWAGCGAHVEQVLGHLPPSERCQGHQEETNEPRSRAKSLLARLGLR